MARPPLPADAPDLSKLWVLRAGGASVPADGVRVLGSTRLLPAAGRLPALELQHVKAAYEWGGPDGFKAALVLYRRHCYDTW